MVDDHLPGLDEPLVKQSVVLVFQERVFVAQAQKFQRARVVFAAHLRLGDSRLTPRAELAIPLLLFLLLRVRSGPSFAQSLRLSRRLAQTRSASLGVVLDLDLRTTPISRSRGGPRFTPRPTAPRASAVRSERNPRVRLGGGGFRRRRGKRARFVFGFGFGFGFVRHRVSRAENLRRLVAPLGADASQRARANLRGARLGRRAFTNTDGVAGRAVVFAFAFVLVFFIASVSRLLPVHRPPLEVRLGLHERARGEVAHVPARGLAPPRLDDPLRVHRPRGRRRPNRFSHLPVEHRAHRAVHSVRDHVLQRLRVRAVHARADVLRVRLAQTQVQFLHVILQARLEVGVLLDHLRRRRVPEPVRFRKLQPPRVPPRLGNFARAPAPRRLVVRGERFRIRRGVRGGVALEVRQVPRANRRRHRVRAMIIVALVPERRRRGRLGRRRRRRGPRHRPRRRDGPPASVRRMHR